MTTIYVQVRGEMWGTPVSLAEAATAGTCPVCQVNHTCFLFAGFFGQNCHGSPCQILLKCSRTRSPPPVNWLAATSSAASASIPGCKGETFHTDLSRERKPILAYFSFLSFSPESKAVLFVEQLSTLLWSGGRARPALQSTSFDANKKVAGWKFSFTSTFQL